MSDASKPTHRVIFDPTITLGHLLTTCALIASVIAWGVRLESRVDQVDRDRTVLERQVERDQILDRARASEAQAEIKASLRRIEDKLDQKADKFPQR